MSVLLLVDDLGELASIIARVRRARLHDMNEYPNWRSEPLFLRTIFLRLFPSIAALLQGPSILAF